METGKRAFVIVVVALFIGGVLLRSGEPAREKPNDDKRPRDPVAEAQRVEDVPKDRPEQKLTNHDRSDMFDPTKPAPLTGALKDQPKQGRITGFDLLDINFRLEREFGIDIPQSELFPESNFQNKSEFVENGTVTRKGILELRSRLPFVDLNEFEKDPTVDHIYDLFTVGSIARYVEGKLKTESSGHTAVIV
jgi:hypothetical protein